jgi:hypothetical protein
MRGKSHTYWDLVAKPEKKMPLGRQSVDGISE